MAMRQAGICACADGHLPIATVIIFFNNKNINIEINNSEYEGSDEWDMWLYATGTDIEVPLTIIYEDGTEETITVYITKDWKYMWEE